ncbi:sigma-70 family RNA polymerase sigma factor [Actinospica sp.]|uniref:sigma-70 family RNA polymerase sigma factor n=1 Tax=Actinospica sp. TaxID=1872142 RepID=UPI002BA223AF|nr:sigma-70 family RNA polymerase sigma factor [Actinospica sp.]HWG28053.1 sigma-70 family RNA polymerase sigma factor [Actinospica sp.]
MDQHHAKTDSAGPDQDPPDKELIDQVREGDLEAFDPLYRRHRDSALRHARYWTRSEAAAEDLSAESFTRVLYAIRNGNGPTEAFRPYLLTAMRNVARDWAEGDRRTLLVPDLVDIAPPEPEQDPVIAALERSMAGQAFMTLPERWQTVLWQTEVEQEGPTQIAPQLGIDAAAVAALAYRAREGLKQAYLQAHITEIGSPACRPFAERLGTHARGKLRGREAAKLRHHLKHCSECVGLFAMLKYVNANIHVLIGPAVVGAAAATRIGIVLATAGGAAGAGGGAAQSGNAIGRVVSKARHASPRQQATVAGAVAAAAVAALAFALTGNESSPPIPVAKPKPSASALVTQPAPAPSPAPKQTPPPPSPTPPQPSPTPTTPSPTPTTPSPSPTPTPPSPTPTTPSPSPTPTTPSPSPSPTQRVNCPGDLLDLELDLLGNNVVIVQVGLNLDITIGGVTIVIPASCSTGGPPHPFPLPSA